VGGGGEGCHLPAGVVRHEVVHPRPWSRPICAASLPPPAADRLPAGTERAVSCWRRPGQVSLGIPMGDFNPGFGDITGPAEMRRPRLVRRSAEMLSVLRAVRHVVDPSMDTAHSPQQNMPGAPSAPVGPAACSYSIPAGSAPSFPAALRPGRRRSAASVGGPRRHRPSRPGSAPL
jgi:hypothetical protein